MPQERVKSGVYREFSVLLRRFVEEVCGVFAQNGIPQRRWVSMIRKAGQTEFPEEERNNYPEAILRLIIWLHTNKLDSVDQVIDLIRREPTLSDCFMVDGVGQPIRDTDFQRRWAINILGAFLRTYFAQAGGSIFNEQAFNLILRGFEKDISTPTMTAWDLSPLMNLQLDSKRIGVAPGLIIRKLTTKELEEWLNQYSELTPMLGPHPPVDVTQLNCAVEVTYKKGRYDAWGSPESRRMTDILVTTLRLFTDHQIYVAFTKTRSNNILFPGGGMSWSRKPRQTAVETTISSANKQDIIKIFNRINALPSGSSLALALRRWDMVFERFNEDDALIDYWIALESLFTPDSSQELGYRASLRIASFVGDGPEVKEQIYEDCKKSYSLRSRIVHGSTKEIKGKSDLVSRTRSYLREALLRALSLDKPFDPTSIEQNLLRNFGQSM